MIFLNKFDLIVKEEPTEEDKADFRALKRLACRWVDKISTYNKELETIKRS